MVSGQDKIYATPKPLVEDFRFNEETARVFDDMLHRSVPFYDEIQRMIGEIVRDFAVDGTNVYDLGCSTGATLLRLQGLERDVTFIGVDSSEAMLAEAARNLEAAGFPHRFRFLQRDLHEGVVVENASVVILSLTLQFVRPLYRERLMRHVAQGLNRQGCVILVEKVLAQDGLLNRLFIRYYYDFKRRNGYSDIEIAQKREALENVLIPYRLEENMELLRTVGFRAVETFFRWYNFTGILALK